MDGTVEIHSFLSLLVLSRVWMGMGEWDDYYWLSTGRESVVVKTLEVLDQEVVASAGKRSPFCTRVAVGALLRSHPLVVERKWPQVNVWQL